MANAILKVINYIQAVRRERRRKAAWDRYFKNGGHW